MPVVPAIQPKLVDDRIEMIKALRVDEVPVKNAKQWITTEDSSVSQITSDLYEGMLCSLEDNTLSEGNSNQTQEEILTQLRILEDKLHNSNDLKGSVRDKINKMSDNQRNEKEKLGEAYEKKDKILVEMIKSYKAKTEFMRYCC